MACAPYRQIRVRALVGGLAVCETSGMTDGKARRRPLAIVLVVLASLLAYVAIVAIWVDRQALNTDNWTQASSQMLENPTVRNRVAEYMVEQLYANVDVQAEIRAALPRARSAARGPGRGRGAQLRRAGSQGGALAPARPGGVGGR